jgi:hypothetical protein
MDQYKPLNDLDARAEELRRVIADAQKSLQEIETLKMLVTKYLPNVLELSAVKRVDAGSALAAVAYTVGRAKRETKRDQIINGVREILSDGRHRLSRELLGDLQQLGVEVGGSDPAALLSSYLSREKSFFESDLKAGGWALRQASSRVRSDDVAPSPDLFINGSASHPPAV